MSSKSVYDIASQKINRGDREGAKKTFKKLLAKDSNDIRALEGISYVCLVSENYEESLFYVDEPIALKTLSLIWSLRSKTHSMRLWLRAWSSISGT